MFTSIQSFSHFSQDSTMSPPIFSLIPSTTISPSKPPISPPLPNHHQLLISRRNAAVFLPLISLIPSLYQPSPATAFSFGISGPKDWLRDQKKKASKFVLAPIDASRNILQNASLLLTNEKSDYTDKDLEQVQNLLRSAARDCIPLERNSFVSFQSGTGVEVCTFTLVLKNAASLLDDKDPIKLEAEAKLNDLIRCFTSLSNVSNETDIRIASNRQKMTDALMDTISSLNKFEQGIKDCLEI